MIEKCGNGRVWERQYVETGALARLGGAKPR